MTNTSNNSLVISNNETNILLTNYNNNNDNTPSFLKKQYEMIEKYLAVLLDDVTKKWNDKLIQIRDIIGRYSSPMIDFDLRIDSLDEYDITGQVSESNRSDNKLLNTYSTEDIKKNFFKHGIVEQLSKRGYHDVNIVIDSSDAFVHRIQISDSKYTLSPDVTHNKHDHLLLDMFIRRKEVYISEILNQKKHTLEEYINNNNIRSNSSNSDNDQNRNSIIPPLKVIDNRYLPQYVVQGELYQWVDLKQSDKVIEMIDYPIKATVIEWLCLQDPEKTFSEERPPLPGQYFPGLGIGKQIDDLFVTAAAEQSRDCLMNNPFRFYNAFMYQSREYFYIDPAIQGLFQSILLDMEPYITKFGLAPVSWAFEFGCIREKQTSRIVKWEFHQQIRPISKRMKLYFQSKSYQNSVTENKRPIDTFYIDWLGHPSLSHFCNFEK